MTRPLGLVLAAAAISILEASAFAEGPSSDSGAIDGAYQWTAPDRKMPNGEIRKGLTTTVFLKSNGKTLSGKVQTVQNSGKVSETEIWKGKIKGDKVSFYVIHTVSGANLETLYSGKFRNGRIKGKSETDWNGDTTTHDWEAVRVK